MKQYKLVLIAFLLAAIGPMVVLRDRCCTDEVTEVETEPLTSVSSAEKAILVLHEAEVTEMDLDDYLVSVVLCEMPASFEQEALKAQAVVARTYALRHAQKSKKHEDAAVCTDSGCCQGYISEKDYLADGGTEEKIEKVRSAVEQTKDLVLVYDNALIDATYFSCSGGMTEDAVAVWGRDVPYLQSTESPGEEIATHYTDTVQLSSEEFAEKLGIDTNSSPSTWLQSIAYTSGGGVDTARICGKEFKGTELRKLLSLRSTAFVMTVLGNTVTITTKGFGHRVGMSQYGAQAMALEGNHYEQILTHYYTGVELVQFPLED